MTNLPMPGPPPEPFLSDPRPVVLVFRAPVFNASETFVRAQAAGLVRYQPLVVGREAKGHVPPGLAGRVLIRPDVERLRAFRPVLVHAHFATDGLGALPLAAALGVPLVTTLHGYDVHRSRAALLGSGRLSWVRYALFQRRLQARGDLFLAVSNALRRRAIAQGFPAERTFTHYNGVDLRRFRPGAGGDGVTILHVGRLVEKKGTAVLLRAFARIRTAHPRARLAIVGDGPLRPQLERLAGELALNRSVTFWGALNSDEVAAQMRQVALLAAPSLTARDGDAEGLPQTIIEAMASGLPVVASDHSGNPEAVEDQQTGFLIPEQDSEALAARLDLLLDSAATRTAMGRAARQLVEARFDLARQTARLEALYDGLRGQMRS
ncbi:glycosyltransferase [Sphingosinicella sp.]|uniref:glycosyltransferase n=1 Tax=Sphingosinicella sp. TaxID=1917971 RepID=UPI004038165D